MKYFLRIEVASFKKGIFHSQQKYVLDLQQEIGLTRFKLCDTSIDPNSSPLNEDESDPLLDSERYQRLVDCLIYLSLTKLTIVCVVNVVSQFMHVPTRSHIKVAYQILKYLKHYPRKGLQYARRGHLHVETSTNVDWVG